MNKPYYLLLAEASDGVSELIFSDFSLGVVLDEMNDERETLTDQGYTHLRITSQMRDEREAWNYAADRFPPQPRLIAESERIIYWERPRPVARID